MFGDKSAAIAHLSAVRELIRMRGGIDTFARVPRRIIIWCEYHGCAAHSLLPTLQPVTPTYTGTDDDDDAHSPFPRGFRALVSATHTRTLSHLPAHWQSAAFPLNRIYHALHLVGIIASPPWEPALLASSTAGRDAVAAVLDDAVFRLLVEMAKLSASSSSSDPSSESPSHLAPPSTSTHPPSSLSSSSSSSSTSPPSNTNEPATHHDDTSSDNEPPIPQSAPSPHHAAAHDHPYHHHPTDLVMLHAAHAYLWTSNSYLPANTPMNYTLLTQLQAALILLEQTTAANTTTPSSSRPPPPSPPPPPPIATWALAVGWTLAKKICSLKPQAEHGGGNVLLKWFADRLIDAFQQRWMMAGGGGGGGARGAAASAAAGGSSAAATAYAVSVMADFPGSDEFSRGWKCFLFHHCCDKRGFAAKSSTGADCVEWRGSGLVHAGSCPLSRHHMTASGGVAPL
ncbi:hypothetical protein DIS24_g9630 [Lasiodiplodia hormozganensis]|uniref:Uncharacterized protein n=1 Tax=Lasiodiplodia hormozganensis TaxID=869390 RepID=A0AA39XVJ9_9PEZI|nr:hypothetical protein DIS24_g9630 [Lasiodiplodia hormozganensis]